MMKKIFNWTFGGFFRTIGRVLAFILIGGLLGYIAFKNDLKITDLLGIGKVKADTTFAWTSKESRIYYDDGGTEKVYNYHTMPYTHTANYPITQMEYRLKYSGGLSAGNTYTFTVSYTPNPDAIYPTGLWFSDGTNLEVIVNCSGWSRNSSGKYSNTCNLTPVADISSSGYLYVRIVYQQAYLTSLKSEISNFTITKGTGAIIQDSAVDIMGNNNDNTNTLIDNQNSNTTTIINNANQNTQNIINNQNANSQAQIESQQVCTRYDKNNIKINGKYLNSSGVETSYGDFGITDYISISNNDKIKVLETYPSSDASYTCYYTKTKTIISCLQNVSLTGTITPPNDAYYIRISIYKVLNKPIMEICKNGNQATTDSINNLNDSLNNSDTSEAFDNASSLFTNFTTNNHGLTGVISAPLTLIRNLASNTCSTLTLPLPFVNENLTLPCLSSIYQQHFPTFLTMYQIIISAIIGYKICISVFFMVKGFKDPGEDKIEVLDL